MPASAKRVWRMLLAFLIIGACILGNAFRQRSRALDYSAHAALTKEICESLEALPAGGPYPHSLSQLRLTHPDGGDSSFLQRFTCTSTGTSCVLRTRLNGTPHLDVSLTLDDIGWHFLNFGHPTRSPKAAVPTRVVIPRSGVSPIILPLWV